MTAFQRAVVVLTAAAVILQLLHPPMYLSLTVGERPDFAATLLRVLAILIAGSTVAWLGLSRESLRLMAGVMVAFIVGWVGVNEWPAWQDARAAAKATCEEAQSLAQGRMEWDPKVTAVSVITAPDGSRWAVSSRKWLASARMPRGWKVETSNTPAFVIVMNETPPVHLKDPSASGLRHWLQPVAPDPPLDKLKSVGLVTNDGWEEVLIALTDVPAPPPGFIVEPHPLVSQLVQFLRRQYPSAYTGQSDEDVAQAAHAAMIIVGGPTERLVHAFCSPARLWLGR